MLLALLGPAAAYALSLAVHFAVRGAFVSSRGVDRAFLLPLVFVLILVVGGPLGEEPAWRGYVLPWLLRGRASVVSGILLGFLWVLWHLPLFWLEGAAREGSS